ncbi:hypothetical protein PIB30_062667 [Stylosanthes scabra]|uniref:Uncharacterized protein n=1 Tax=Stylosanthes scabra TaxID=79078 RepID=A0ABU6SL68_9FABA|nr:hypothetical protein [Stylosanthes scabra]
MACLTTNSSLASSGSSPNLLFNHENVTVQASRSPSSGSSPNISRNQSQRQPLWHQVLEVPKAATHRLVVNGETQLICNILEGDSALAARHVERMGLWLPPLYEGANEQLVNLEPVIGQSCNREQTGSLLERNDAWMLVHRNLPTDTDDIPITLRQIGTSIRYSTPLRHRFVLPSTYSFFTLTTSPLFPILSSSNYTDFLNPDSDRCRTQLTNSNTNHRFFHVAAAELEFLSWSWRSMINSLYLTRRSKHNASIL